MEYKKLLAIGAVALLACITAAAQQAKSKPETIRFKFSLPNGLTYVERQQTVRTATVEGRSESQTRENESATRYSVKQTPSGYDIVVSAISAAARRNGQPFADPMVDAFKGISLVYRIASNGKFLELHGAEQAVQQIMAATPEQIRPNMQKLLTVEALKARAQSDWNARVPRFLSMSGEIGDAWASTDRAPLMTGGEAIFYTVSTLAGRAPCGNRSCVRVTLAYNTDPKQLSKQFGASVSKMLDELGAKSVNFSDVEIVGGGEFLVDPETSMVQSERIDRTMKMLISLPGQGSARTTTKETRTVSFEYSR